MEFRWLAFLVLWTVFSGPIFSRPNTTGRVATADSRRNP
jgi:hypothetical protein